ncbi:MAG: redoxin domain-containing protein [candidate division WOR-3 bacterium]
MKRKIFWIFIIISTIFIVLLFLFSVYQTYSNKEEKEIVKKASYFKLPKIDNLNDSLSLDDLKGKVVILNFWASWCEPCKEEVKELNKIYESLKDSIMLIGINIWDDRKKALSFIEKYNVKFLNLFASRGNPISVNYGITGVPETIIVDKEGYIKFHFKGPITYEIIIRSLKQF